MNDRLFASSGITSIVLTMVGAITAMVGGKTHELMVSTSTAKLSADLAQPATTASWIGAYVELIGCVLFLVFAVWACAKLGGGIWGTVGVAAATAYTAVTVASLALMDAISYRAGKGVDLGLAKVLVTLNEALYVTTWFLFALFLAAAAVLAVSAGRSLIGWSAAAIAAFTLVATPAFNGLGQAAGMLFFAWVIGTSIALLRRRPQPLRQPVPA